MHTHLRSYLALAVVCKVDLLCGLPHKKGEKVTASGRKNVYTPSATLIGVHNPCTPTQSAAFCKVLFGTVRTETYRYRTLR